MSSFSEPELIRQFNELDDGGASAWHASFMRLKNAALEGAGERTCKIATSSLNRFKNRYQDVVPFDQARVVLAKESIYQNYERPEELLLKAEEVGLVEPVERGPTDSPKQLVERAKLFSDYVNASPVKCPQAGREYILTQGPVASTTVDLWEMIWEQRCSVIVMLNNLVEKGMSKCYPYYPNVELLQGKPLHYLSDSRFYVIPTQDSTSPNRPLFEYYFPDLSLRVQLMSETDCSSYVLRRLRLVHLPHSFLTAIPLKSSSAEDPPSKQSIADLLADPIWESSGEVREVQHFHYRVWADFSVPDVPSFLNLLLAVRRTQVFEKGSIVMHCSAGVGRSGTFALVDSALRIVEQKRTLDAVDLPQLLLTLRSSRMGLVQTPDQLRFCYTAVIEGARLILSALERADPDTPVEEVVNALDCEALLREPSARPSAAIDENNHPPSPSLAATPRSTHSEGEKPPKRSKSRPEPPPVPSRSSLASSPTVQSPPTAPQDTATVSPAVGTSARDSPAVGTSARRRTTDDAHDSREEREERIRQKTEAMKRKQQELLQRTGLYWGLRHFGLALAESILPAPLPRPSSPALVIGTLAAVVLAVGLWFYLQ